MTQFLRYCLFPITLLYALVTRIRNHLYDIGYTRSFSFETNVIAIGNLSAGGSGKTPTVEYLVELLKDKYQLATLSRGYGRNTQGFILANEESNANTIGDEPFQFYRKYKNQVQIAVGEERALAIPQILANHHETEVILLDDAFQHRAVRPDLNILLTPYKLPFYKDFILPTGMLREARTGAARADIVIVTKCPALSKGEMEEVKKQIQRYYPGDHVFFTCLEYGKPVNMEHVEVSLDKPVIGFSGIADNRVFESYLRDNFELRAFIPNPDHQTYSRNYLVKKLESLDLKEAIFVTTEKDWVKLIQPENWDIIKELEPCYVPVRHKFLQNGPEFDALVLNSIKKY